MNNIQIVQDEIEKTTGFKTLLTYDADDKKYYAYSERTLRFKSTNKETIDEIRKKIDKYVNTLSKDFKIDYEIEQEDNNVSILNCKIMISKKFDTLEDAKKFFSDISKKFLRLKIASMNYAFSRQAKVFTEWSHLDYSKGYWAVDFKRKKIIKREDLKTRIKKFLQGDEDASVR